MTLRVAYTDERSHKFCEVGTRGNSHTVRYGRIGAKGQVKTKRFSAAPRLPSGTRVSWPIRRGVYFPRNALFVEPTPTNLSDEAIFYTRHPKRYILLAWATGNADAASEQVNSRREKKLAHRVGYRLPDGKAVAGVPSQEPKRTPVA